MATLGAVSAPKPVVKAAARGLSGGSSGLPSNSLSSPSDTSFLQDSVPPAPSHTPACQEDPFVSSLDDPTAPPGTTRLGYKDELDKRFIWDRVIGRGKNGTVRLL
jgi:hypothetical protein